MIKTKTAFIIFLFLSIIIFPYYIIYLNSDSLSSIVPGWNTNVTAIRIISNLIKFLILSIVSFYYWKLSKTSNEINFQKFIIHLVLTIPAVIVAKLNLYEFVTLNLHDPDIFLSQIQMVVYINTFINILFFVGQILFWVFYFRFQKSSLSIQ